MGGAKRDLQNINLSQNSCFNIFLILNRDGLWATDRLRGKFHSCGLYVDIKFCSQTDGLQVEINYKIRDKSIGIVNIMDHSDEASASLISTS